MTKKKSKKQAAKEVVNLVHGDASRVNIPTVELEPIMRADDRTITSVRYERASATGNNPREDEGLVAEAAARDSDLDPQLIWRSKSAEPLDVPAPPLFIQEKVHPKALVDDLRRQTEAAKRVRGSGEKRVDPDEQFDLFENFNGLPDDLDARTDFYRHDMHWQNRMILGDSLQVMSSLLEREGLRSQVQCVYLDPPYGIKFNSNFQWSTTSREVKDGRSDHITREPEQVKAFRDTWRDGIHSYLTYLRDRLTVAHELLHESGSIFVQIGDENVHRVRLLVDEMFGDDNFVSQIFFKKTNPLGSSTIGNVGDSIIWYAKDKKRLKFRKKLIEKKLGPDGVTGYSWFEDQIGQRRRLQKADWAVIDDLLKDGRVFAPTKLTAAGLTPSCVYTFDWQGRSFSPKKGSSWRTNLEGMHRVVKAKKLIALGESIYQAAYFDDNPTTEITNIWSDTRGEMAMALTL